MIGHKINTIKIIKTTSISLSGTLKKQWVSFFKKEKKYINHFNTMKSYKKKWNLITHNLYVHHRFFYAKVKKVFRGLHLMWIILFMINAGKIANLTRFLKIV